MGPSPLGLLPFARQYGGEARALTLSLPAQTVFRLFSHAASAFPGKRKEMEEGDCCFSKGKRRVGCPGLEKEKV